ncbi:MAG: hypothetical protein II969_01265 [Anaerolineaceae bacterium]|nr:hypothetical protein [Anaerolineaceae bacterium]
MCKDKKMFALIIAIFLSVLFITGWVFADRNVMDLINVTPILEMKNTASAPAPVTVSDVPAAVVQAPESEICTIGEENCR